jgi:hypothetical protein
MPDGSMVRDARVFVTSLRLLAYVARDYRVERVVDVQLSVPGAVPACRGSLGNGRLECPVLAGTVWVNRARGCGCGSPLKGLAPPVGWTG